MSVVEDTLTEFPVADTVVDLSLIDDRDTEREIKVPYSSNIHSERCCAHCNKCCMGEKDCPVINRELMQVFWCDGHCSDNSFAG